MTVFNSEGQPITVIRNDNKKEDKDDNFMYAELDPLSSYRVPSATQYSIKKAAYELQQQTSQESKLNKAKKRPLSIEEVNNLLTGGKVDAEGNPTIVAPFDDPYSDNDKRNFHDAYRRHPTVRNAINIQTNFLLGRRTKTVLDTNKDYSSDEEQKTEYERIVNNETYKQYKSEIDNINRKVKFLEKLESAVRQAKVFGRSCLLVEKGDDGLPVAVKVLSSMSLARVFVFKDSWEVAAIEYKDFNGPESIIPAENLIYFENLNDHMTPNTLHYGLSDLEPVVALTETDRVAMEMDMKEIVRSLWASFIIAKIDTQSPNYGPGAVGDFIKKFKVGRSFATKQAVDVQAVQVGHDLDKLVSMISENSKTILAGLNIPQALGGKEESQNRANAVATIESWFKTAISKQRTWLRGIIESQWIDRIVKSLVTNGIPDKGIDPQNEGEYNVLVKPNMDLAKIDDVADYEFKIKFQFEEFIVATILESYAGVIGLETSNIIDRIKALELLDMQDVIDRLQIQSRTEAEIEADNQKKMVDQMNLLKQKSLAGQQQQDNNKQDGNNNMQIGLKGVGNPNLSNPKNRLPGNNKVQ